MGTESDYIWAWKLLAGFSIMIMCVCFSLLPLVFKKISEDLRDRLLGLANAFAGGVFLSGGLVHLLLEASNNFNTVTHPPESDHAGEISPLAFVFCAVGIMMTFFIEKVLFGGDMPACLKALIPPEPVKLEKSTPSEVFDIAVSEALKEAEHEQGHHHHEHFEHHEYDTEEDFTRESMDTLKASSKGTDGVGTEEEQTTTTETNALTKSKATETAHSHGHGHGSPDQPLTVVALIVMLVLSLHSFMGGLSMGVQTKTAPLFAIYIAIAAHKWVEAFALGVAMMRSGTKLTRVIFMALFYACTTPIGVIIGMLLLLLIEGAGREWLIAITTGLSAGTFLYVAMIDVLVIEFAIQTDKYWKFLLVILGFVLNASLVLLFDEHEEE